MSTVNKNNQEALEKLKKLTNSIETCMMLTGLDKRPIHANPMTQKKIDQEGNIWFLSPGDSEHNKNITQSRNTQLIYNDTQANTFVSVYGETKIVLEDTILNELYTSISDNWFNGVDDPNLTALKFTPTNAYYWDTKTNKFISFLKIAKGSITGEKQDIGNKGHLNL